jgi:HlyD family secretion protein
MARADSVLTLKEALVQFDAKTQVPFVEVMTGEQQFKRRDIELGISDGINVEIKSGITVEDAIKVWNKIKASREFGQ